MTKKYTNIKRIIVPNKKINLFVICILFLGVIAGAIYTNIIGLNDRNLVIDKIKLFIDNINSNSLKTLLVFKNSIGVNLGYVFIIWVLGMSLIGLIFNMMLLFIKGFIFGFSIASFIVTYGIKGIVVAFIYMFFGQLLNIVVTLLLTIYSIMLSFKLLKVILKKNTSDHFLPFLKNYAIILVISIILSLISSVFETFLLPSLIKLVIKLYI